MSKVVEKIMSMPCTKSGCRAEGGHVCSNCDRKFCIKHIGVMYGEKIIPQDPAPPQKIQVFGKEICPACYRLKYNND